MMKQPCILRYSLLIVALATFAGFEAAPLMAQADDGASGRPNIILLMADDLGYGDVGFNGNEGVETPHLDRMAETGVVFDRFYTASSICSPTRGSVLTGRHPYRYGILAAHTAGMRQGEITVAEILKKRGYATGFFGKWHLGWVRPDLGRSKGHYSPSWHHGFDESFCTTSAVPTWNPGVTPTGWNKWGHEEGTPWGSGNPYVHNGEVYTGPLEGDDSRIMMDRAIPFIEEQVAAGKPFLAVIWFHAPHEPVVAGPEYLERYAHLESETLRHYYGCVTAMDDQIGRLNEKLEELGVDEETAVFFTSDNGPSAHLVRQGILPDDGLRGHKHVHYEGGIRVPSVAVWPGYFEPRHTEVLSGTVDYLPTIVDLIGEDLATVVPERPVDGVSLLPALIGSGMERKGFVTAGYMRLANDYDGIALIEQRYKLIRENPAEPFELFDLVNDPAETENLASAKPEQLEAMVSELDEWQESARASREGADYSY